MLRALDEHGSVTEVARLSHRTPSAVSQQLRQAARELGHALVEPAGRGLRLTAAGPTARRGRAGRGPRDRPRAGGLGGPPRRTGRGDHPVRTAERAHPPPARCAA
ncbi:LysR family transcriptional regulator [Brevibacterium casei]|uniref:helix-turn-helix domain-containing protein n=1 Tax=Brevibacterium casei TaxID=33889 RepID=UPI001EE7A004|nr:LysR family transcriptional regulator [Brevibacterium casei]